MKYDIKKAKSGIKIKPENKGKFTATKKKTGKTTEELTHSKNPVTKKRAVFAQNAKHWKHQKGGTINVSHIRVTKFKSGGEVQYQNGIDNSFYKKPKYDKAKCGKKLVKKKQVGGSIFSGNTSTQMQPLILDTISAFSKPYINPQTRELSIPRYFRQPDQTFPTQTSVPKSTPQKQTPEMIAAYRERINAGVNTAIKNQKKYKYPRAGQVNENPLQNGPSKVSPCFIPNAGSKLTNGGELIKNQSGGYISKSVEQDKRNQDYLNNPFNLERLKTNAKNLISSLKLPATAAALGGAAYLGAFPGLAMMGYGAGANAVAGATAVAGGALAPLVGYSFSPWASNSSYPNQVDKFINNEKAKMVTPDAVYSWLNSNKKK